VRLGELEFTVVKDGGFRLDGGAMFGVVPKPLWEKRMPADERNRIGMDMNCLLIRSGGKLALVETGAGDKMSPKLQEIYDLGKGKRLLENLAAKGVKPEQIDIVINTHLHFDHCGWNTRVVNGKLAPTFPNATYYVQLGELEHAKHPTERDSASYFPENFLPIEEAGQWRLLEKDAVILPGVEVIRVPGHNADMQCVRLTGGGQTAFFFVDLVPTTAHLPYAWLMGYDLYPLTTLENKKKWIPEVAREGWLALFAHDAKVVGAHLRVSDKGDVYVAEPVEIE